METMWMKPFERLRAAATFEAYDRPPLADNEWNETLQLMVPHFESRLSYARDALGDIVIGLPYLSVGLDGLYRLAGWDIMAPASVECPEGIADYLDAVADHTVQCVHLYAEHITAAHCPVALAYSDIAYNNGLLLSPAFLRRTLWPALRKMVAAYHEHGIKVIYHSEGNLHQFLDDLIGAGSTASTRFHRRSTWMP